VAYGTIATNGIINNSWCPQGAITCTHSSSTGYYDIGFPFSFSTSSYTTLANVILAPPNTDIGFCVIYENSGKLRVLCLNTSGTYVDRPFSFVVFAHN
jgi:hypothetical protein